MMLINMFKHRDVRKKVIFTLLMLLAVRLGSSIVVPKADSTMLTASGTADSGLLGLMNLLGGGALQQFSILGLGISPYITASIVVQLLSMDVIPSLTEWSKQGEQGRKKLDRVTRFVTVALAFLQAIFLTRAFNTSYKILLDGGKLSTYIFVAIVLTAGTMFLMWVADQITAKGIGNGTSLIIFTGIVASLPSQLIRSYNTLVHVTVDGINYFSKWGLVKFSGIILFYIVIIILVIYIEQAVRKIPIQYASNNGKARGQDMTHMPIKVNSAGVIPVIFASSVLMLPITIASFYPSNWVGQGVMKWVGINLPMDKPLGFALYIIFIVLFAFFYANLQIDVEKINEDFSKSGAYIPGVRPGKETKQYISTVLNRLTVVGSAFLVFIAALPLVIQMTRILPQGVNLSLSGTGMIIVVGVALETTKQIAMQLKKKIVSRFCEKIGKGEDEDEPIVYGPTGCR